MPRDDTADVLENRARGAMRALRHIGEDLIARSVPRAPIEEGTLRGSAAVAFIVNGQRLEGAGAYELAVHLAVRLARAGLLRSLRVEVSFNTVYAARQHEEVEWNHPLGGEAKYLERPLLEGMAGYRRALELEDRIALATPT